MAFYYYVLNFAHVKLLCYALHGIYSYLRLRHTNLIRFIFILLITNYKQKFESILLMLFFYLIKNKHDEVPLSDEGIIQVTI